MNYRNIIYILIIKLLRLIKISGKQRKMCLIRNYSELLKIIVQDSQLVDSRLENIKRKLKVFLGKGTQYFQTPDNRF